MNYKTLGKTGQVLATAITCPEMVKNYRQVEKVNKQFA